MLAVLLGSRCKLCSLQKIHRLPFIVVVVVVAGVDVCGGACVVKTGIVREMCVCVRACEWQQSPASRNSSSKKQEEKKGGAARKREGGKKGERVGVT